MNKLFPGIPAGAGTICAPHAHVTAPRKQSFSYASPDKLLDYVAYPILPVPVTALEAALRYSFLFF